MGLRRFVTFVVVVLVIYLIAVAYVFFFAGPSPSRRDVAKARAGLYQSWCNETGDAYEAFKELARERGWRMYVSTYEGPPVVRGLTTIGRLECGESIYVPLYQPQTGRSIETVAAFRGGQTAFIECTRARRSWWRRTKPRHLELGVLYSDGSLTKLQLPDMQIVSHLAIGNRCVFFCDFFERLWLYDIQEETLREVQRPEGWEGIAGTIGMLADRFLFILSTRDVLHVVRSTAPYAEVSRIAGVSEMLLVGERIIIEKDDTCFLYNTESGGTEHLTPGKLVAPLGQNEFLFCGRDTSYPAYTRCTLNLYDIAARSQQVFWQPPKEDGGFRVKPGKEKYYDYAKLILSPDRRFLFVPREIPAYRTAESLMVFEYNVFDLGSGEKRGSFLTIHEGQFCFEFLGWDTGDQGARPAVPRP